MKKSRFTEEQIAFGLKQAELGTSDPEIFRKVGISDATFYKNGRRSMAAWAFEAEAAPAV